MNSLLVICAAWPGMLNARYFIADDPEVKSSLETRVQDCYLSHSPSGGDKLVATTIQ